MAPLWLTIGSLSLGETRRFLMDLPVSRHQAVFLVWQLLTFLLGKEAIFSWELYTFPQKMSALPRLLLSSYTGREIALLNPLGPPGQGRFTTPSGQAGKVIGTPQAQAYTAFPGGQCNLQGRQHHPTPPVGLTKVLQMKNPTLSGSLTFPTNPWHQLKGLFWLKDPTLRLPLGGLLT